MGKLYDMSQRLMSEMETRYPDSMDLLKAKGEAARSAGFMISLITANDVDDPEKIERLRTVARELGIEL